VKLYCLSGLGVDERAFKNIKADGVELVHIAWIDPLPKETLEQYAKRLFDQIKPEDGYNLLGVSFGGMIATEFAKLKKPSSAYFISTVQSKGELPFLFKVAGLLQLHKIIPSRLLTKSNFIINYLFGVKTKEDKKLLKEILRDTDPKFLKWAMGAILSWKNRYFSGIGIHGGKDKMLGYKRKMDYVIPGGGHFMIVNRANEISAVIGK